MRGNSCVGFITMTTALQIKLPPQAFLDTHRQDELDELFSSLASVDAADLSGDYQGRLIGISGLSILPRFVKWLAYKLLGTWLNPWRGKRFDSSHGKNLWGIASLVSGWGAYRVSTNSEDNLISLDYGVSENPRFLRPILGEARPFGNGIWLARMRYRTRNNINTLLYFTLRRVGQ